MGQEKSSKKTHIGGKRTYITNSSGRYVFFSNFSLVPFFYTTRIEVVFPCPILLHHENWSRLPLSHSFTSLENRKIPTYLPFYMPEAFFHLLIFVLGNVLVKPVQNGNFRCKKGPFLVKIIEIIIEIWRQFQLN